MKFMTLGFGAALLSLAINQASAADQVSASFSWTSAQIANLRITRDGRPIILTNRKVDLVFTDPRTKSEIEKILLDPEYRPGDVSAADFFLETAVVSPISKKKVKETSLCYWNGDPSRVSPKSVAICSIEDDGGRLMIVTENRSNSLASSHFALFVLGLDGYSGFRIAEDAAVGKEPNGLHGISVQLKAGLPVRAPIKF